jgi:hypothetical protein
MSLDVFANMFSQRRGIDQSIAGSVINAIIGLVQQGGVGNLSLQEIVTHMKIEWVEYNRNYQTS